MTSDLPLEQLYYEFDGFWNPSNSVLDQSDAERVRQARRLIPAEVVSILDLGCGNGIFCNYVQEQTVGIQVVGLDRSRTALKYVNTDKIVGNVVTIPFGKRSFDCVVALELLEHLPIRAYEAARKEIARVARHYILVSVPNDQILGKSLTECPACRTRFDPDLHLRSFDSAAVARLFSNHGFECKEIQGIGTQRSHWGFQFFSGLRGRWLAKRAREMQSPICPICGYTNDRFLQGNAPEQQLQRHGNQWKQIDIAKKSLKRVWPQIERTRWLVGLYVRANSGDV